MNAFKTAETVKLLSLHSHLAISGIKDKHLVRLGLGIRGSLVEMLGLQANQYLSFTKEMNISASPTGIL